MKKLLSLLLTLGLTCAPCGMALAASAQPAPAPAAAAAKPAPAAPQKVEAGYRGNPSSKVYHNSSCRHYKSKGASKVFASPAEAKAAGFKPCKVCKG